MSVIAILTAIWLRMCLLVSVYAVSSIEDNGNNKFFHYITSVSVMNCTLKSGVLVFIMTVRKRVLLPKLRIHLHTWLIKNLDLMFTRTRTTNPAF